jgi:hypothetical protein
MRRRRQPRPSRLSDVQPDNHAVDGSLYSWRASYQYRFQPEDTAQLTRAERYQREAEELEDAANEDAGERRMWPLQLAANGARDNDDAGYAR